MLSTYKEIHKSDKILPGITFLGKENDENTSRNLNEQSSRQKLRQRFQLLGTSGPSRGLWAP